MLFNGFMYISKKRVHENGFLCTYSLIKTVLVQSNQTGGCVFPE
jgi:hypothetical protein